MPANTKRARCARQGMHKLMRSIDGPTVPANTKTKRALLRCNRVCGVLSSQWRSYMQSLGQRTPINLLKISINYCLLLFFIGKDPNVG